MASNTGLPVYDVRPRHPVASITPATAAPSSNITVTALGSRPLITAKKIQINYYNICHTSVRETPKEHFQIKVYEGK